MTTATQEPSWVDPFDIPQIPLTFEEFENFQRNVLHWPEYRRFEMRGRISNVLLGRNQSPTQSDMVIAERIYQNGVMREFMYRLQWQSVLSPTFRFLYVDVILEGDDEQRVIGQIRLRINHHKGLTFSEIFQHVAQEVVVDFQGYRVFDNCQECDYGCLGWPYVKSLQRDVRLWAGEKAGTYYSAFVNYVEQLVERQIVQNFEVVLSPECDGGVKLQVRAHRGGVQLAGFTTMVEFNEVLYNAKGAA